MITLLDVTLRDGGYTNSFRFEEQAAIQIVDLLHQAGIDMIEIGYRNGPEKGAAGLGLTARVDRAFLLAVRSRVPNAKISVMLHPNNIAEHDLAELKETGVDLVRICMRAERLQQGLQAIRTAKRHGLTISANFVRVTDVSPWQVREWMLAAEAAGADLIYFADSNGHMVPDQVKEYAEIFKKSLQTPLGFHAHNNLTLSLSNTLAAIESGVELIDTSLRGLGRGAGNLPTEVYVAYLERNQVNHGYDLVRIIQAAEYLESHVACRPLNPGTFDLMFGMANLSSDFVRPVAETAESEAVPWQQLVLHLKRSKHKPNPQDVRRFLMT